MSRPKMTRRIGLLASLAVLLVGFLGCSVDTPTAPDQVATPPPTQGGNNWNISVSVTPDELEAASDTPSTVEVRVTSRDDGSDPPDGTTMTLSTTLGEFGDPDSEPVERSIGVITDRGKASALLFAGDVAAGGTVTARLEGSEGRDSFRILEAVDPFILSVSPSEGPESGGTVVTITGVGFSVDSRVFFGSKLGTVTSISDDRITVITPPADIAGTQCNILGQNGLLKQDLSVSVIVEAANGGTETLANAFTYRVAQPGVCVPTNP